ncbi:MAG: lyase family protein [Propionibacteriaceae bacterium]|nr:lyase family protein [Propionibacteriaceae bacterium]
MTDPQSTHLYGEQTVLAIENMSFSGRTLEQFPEVIRSIVQVKEAAAEANAECGHVDRGVASRIVHACHILKNLNHTDQFLVDVFHGGGGTAVNMNVNEVLGSLAGDGVDAFDHINASQSSSDVCHTAIRLAIYDQSHVVTDSVTVLIDVLRLQAEDTAGVDTIARTCLQDGMAAPISKLFGPLAGVLETLLEDLSSATDKLLDVNIGGTVIGSGYGASPAYRQAVVPQLAKITGLPLTTAPDLYAVTQYPVDLSRISAVLTMLSRVLAKFSQDLRLLSSGPDCGFNELQLPTTQKGSTYYPGKVNPVIPETFLQCDLLVSANDSIIQRCLGMGEQYYNLWDATMGFLLLENIRMLGKAIRLLTQKCVAGIEVNSEVCQTYATSTMPSILQLKEELGYQAITDEINKDGAASFLRHHSEPETERTP